MSNRLLSYLIIIGLVGMTILVLLPYSGLQVSLNPDKFFSPNNIKTIEVFYKDKPYPLNFNQQNQVIEILNRSVFIEPEAYFKAEEIPFKYEKIVIYPIEGTPIELKPVGIIRQQLILKSPTLNPKGYIRETGPGELHPLLNHVFDE